MINSDKRSMFEEVPEMGELMPVWDCLTMEDALQLS